MGRSAGLQIRGGAEIRREATKLRAQRSGIGFAILIAIYITIFACIYHKNDNDISAIYALRRDPQGVGGAGHDWERPTHHTPKDLNRPAFRREALPDD